MSASNPGRVFRARWNASFRRTARGHSSSRSWFKKSSVELVLWDSGAARLMDVGERRTSVLVRQTGHRGTLRKWSNAWQGTWKRRGKDLLVKLTPKGLQCSRVHTRLPAGATTQQRKRLSCPKAPRGLVLVCQPDTVVLGSPYGRARAAAPPEPVWRCRSRRPGASTHGTDEDFVFGIKGCLQRMGGNRIGYERCPAPPRPTP